MKIDRVSTFTWKMAFTIKAKIFHRSVPPKIKKFDSVPRLEKDWEPLYYGVALVLSCLVTVLLLSPRIALGAFPPI